MSGNPFLGRHDYDSYTTVKRENSFGRAGDTLIHGDHKRMFHQKTYYVPYKPHRYGLGGLAPNHEKYSLPISRS